jgi:tRNA-dihydrouridine synthase
MLSQVMTDKVMFLGADNYLRPDTLERLDTVDADIVSYDIALFGDQVEEFRKIVPCLKQDGYYIWRGALHGSSLYNVEKEKAAGGYVRNPHSVKTEEDKMLFEKMLEQGALRHNLSEPLLYYRRHKHNFQ